VEGVGVVVAEDTLAAVQGVLMQSAGPLVVAQHVQDVGEVAGGAKGVGMVVTQVLLPSFVPGSG